MKRVITAAENDKVNPMDELKDILEDDFGYFLAGVEKLQREGDEPARAAYTIAIELNDALQAAISSISEYM